jgi:hypothetical protein
MNSRLIQLFAGVALGAGLAACGGGDGAAPSSTSSGGSITNATGNVSVLMSDDSSEDWAAIGVKVLSVALVPQGGGANVTVYTAAANAPLLNLAELDQISDLLASAAVPTGTYTSAVLTIAANPGDVLLNAASNPSAGFAGTAAAAVAASDIQIQGAQGASGSRTTAVTVRFESPLVVSAGQNNAVDLEVDLNHPVLIVGHTTLAGGMRWAVNLNGPVRHHRIADITRLVLRHMYGTVSTVAGDNTSITVARALPKLPATSPETAVSTGQSVQVLADAANGTIFYDVDAKTAVTVRDFASEASNLMGKNVRVAARYQSNGTLVATRIWASTDFNRIWLSPEGHVLHVDTASNNLAVMNEAGGVVTLKVNANTEFVSGTTSLGTGTAFLAAHNLQRGFKVHASVVDPLASPLVAQTVEVQTAAFSGSISAASTLGFTYTRRFLMASDNYTAALNYIAATTANGTDSSGAAITGFKYWDFAYPTQVTSGGSAVPNFIAATGGSVNFGGSVGAIPAWGVSFARWGDGASSTTGWYAPWTILEPVPVPLGTVATALAGNTFTMNVLGGNMAGTVTLGTTSGSATLVYQLDRTGGVLTVSPVDITSTSGLNAVTAALISGTRVKVAGVPQADGTLRAYVLTYYTGDLPMN